MHFSPKPRECPAPPKAEGGEPYPPNTIVGNFKPKGGTLQVGFRRQARQKGSITHTLSGEVWARRVCCQAPCLLQSWSRRGLGHRLFRCLISWFPSRIT